MTTVHQGLGPSGAEGTRNVRYLLAVRPFAGTNAKDFRGRTGAHSISFVPSKTKVSVSPSLWKSYNQIPQIGRAHV